MGEELGKRDNDNPTDAENGSVEKTSNPAISPSMTIEEEEVLTKKLRELGYIE